ncbi:MAG: hypothetical protein VXV77_04735 [Bacteroidota bacterium]|nr:hypothetical protein [Bacteroidota bacterium]
MRILIILLFISFLSFAQEDIERFKLYPTENIYTVLLQDVMEGTTFQLQWIPDNIQFFELD